MPLRPTSSPTQFIQGAPVLHVRDVKATATFYRDVLGFAWDFGDENYAVVWRDNSAIHFVKGSEQSRAVHLFQWVVDVDDYYREVTGTGARITVPIRDQSYGIREFTLQDLNGVDVIFGQEIASSYDV